MYKILYDKLREIYIENNMSNVDNDSSMRNDFDIGLKTIMYDLS